MTADEGTFEMLWDCPRCGTPKLLGLTHRHCPACGAPQDPNHRYYPSDADKVAVHNHVYFGADKSCPGCDTPNSANSTFCTGCGMPLDGSARQVHARVDQQVGHGQSFAGESVGAAKQEIRDRRDAQVAQALGKNPEGKKSSKGLIIGLVIGGILLVVAALVFVLLFWKKEANVEVEGHQWVRTIEIERYDTVTESDWCDSMPRGASKLSSKKAQRSTKKVQDGEECTTKRKDNRDGTFKQVKDCKPKYREEPVYGDKCTFKIDKWKTVRTEKAEGQSISPEPSWPAYELAKKGNCKGCERVGDKGESYTVLFVDKAESETHQCEFPLDKWKAAQVGTKWSAQVGVVAGGLDCDELQPK